MSDNATHPAARRLARIGLVLVMGAGLALASMASSPQATTLAQPVSTATDTPEPTAIPPCPADRIDRNHNGQDNGDCVPLTNAAIPLTPIECVVQGGGLAKFGRVACQPKWRVSGDLRSIPVPALQVNKGCLSVRRNPYPRLMVGLGAPTMSFEGLIPTNSSSVNPAGWMTGYAAGWYQTNLSGIGAAGLPAQGYYAAGNWMNQSFGTVYPGAPFPPVRLDSPSSDFYPGVNNISMRLVFALDRDNHHPLEVSFVGAEPVRWNGAEPLALFVSRSSNPNALVGSDSVILSGGPTRSGPATLPAYRLQVRSTWTLYVQVYYEYWRINAGIYERDPSRPAELYATVANGLENEVSFRAWDTQQGSSAGLIGAPNCNADEAEGYIPVPVLEGQSVLVR